MKKSLFWGMAILTAFIFFGCQTDDDSKSSSGPDGAKTPTGWDKGLNDLVVQTGDKPGEIKYTFSATDPAAASYTLYYIGESKDKAKDIIAQGNSIAVSPGSGSISNLDINKSYSIVVVAIHGDLSDAISGVKTANTGGGFTLTVNGIKTGIMGASLLNPLNFEESIAIGMDISMSGNFAFYHPAEPGSPMPIDMSKPFGTSGSYIIALAAVDAQFNPVEIHLYTVAGMPAPYDFTNTATALDWSSFVDMTSTLLP